METEILSLWDSVPLAVHHSELLWGVSYKPGINFCNQDQKQMFLKNIVSLHELDLSDLSYLLFYSIKIINADNSDDERHLYFTKYFPAPAFQLD